ADCWEHVPSKCSVPGKTGGQSNMDVFLSQMAAHGYECQPVLTDSSEFGLPASRRRLYVFLVRVEANPLLSFQDRSVDSIFSAFGGLLSGCVRQGPCASEVLLADDDPAVLADLTHRMQRREELSQYEKPSSTEWADHHMKMAESLRVRWDQGAQPNVSNNSWYKTLTDREQDALPLLQVQSPGSLMRDLSQSINRANAFTWKAEAGKHIAPTMLPKMNLWLDFQRLLFLERLDTFQAQAEAAGLVAQAAQQSNTKPLVKRAKHPHQVNERIDFRKQDLLLTWRPTETVMQDLAGNTMSLPVVMTMLQCAFVAVNWQSAGEVRRAADAPATTQQD
ncbi:unnamed protein product, partial [Cladocopium goreaui]